MLESSKLNQEIVRRAEQLLPEMSLFRQELHKIPELKWKEVKTAALIRQRLKEIPGIEIGPTMAETGFVAMIRGNKPGPTIALRADMDALPITEQNRHSYGSQHQGTMHACGHDGHMANLVGAAKLITGLRDHLLGNVKLIFQPAEEQGGGAKLMVEAGCLDDVDFIFGLHGWPRLPRGTVGVKNGPLLAASAKIHFTVKGKGGHAAMPHLAHDPIVAAAALITQLQTVVSRRMSPTSPAVLSICQIQGGTTTNVIPDTVQMAGVIRAVTPDGLKQISTWIREQATALGGAYGVSIAFEMEEGYPPTINEARATDQVRAVVKSLFGAEALNELTEPTMGAEDFSYYLQKKPGSFVFLGLEEPGSSHPSLHHPAFDFNDQALRTGMSLFAGMVLLPK